MYRKGCAACLPDLQDVQGVDLHIQVRGARCGPTYTGPWCTVWTYWAIQAGLVTPLTFARHRLSPLNWLLLLPVRTFFTMGGGDSEFANFTLPTLKAFLEARSHNVSGNKQ